METIRMNGKYVSKWYEEKRDVENKTNGSMQKSMC